MDPDPNETPNADPQRYHHEMSQHFPNQLHIYYGVESLEFGQMVMATSLSPMLIRQQIREY
jgi:hypothetical protein